MAVFCTEIERDNWLAAIADIIGDTAATAVVQDLDNPAAAKSAAENPLADFVSDDIEAAAPEPSSAQLQAAADTQAWMSSPSIADESRAKTTEELVAEAGNAVKTTAELVSESQAKTAVGVGEGATL